MNIRGFRQSAGRIVAAVIFVGALGALVKASAPSQNVQSWSGPPPTNPITITFSVPNTYASCEENGSDSVFTTGVPANYRLKGQILVAYVINDGTAQQLIQTIPIDTFGNISLNIVYPPLSDWPLNGTIKEIHVSPQIEVTENGFAVPWVGNDPVGAPGTLGPGTPASGWDVFCVNPPPPPPPPPPPGDALGCTPGYWRQTQHFGQYPNPPTPSTTYESVFGDVPTYGPSLTFAQATDLNGGALKQLIKHSAAAYLNATKFGGAVFGMTPIQVVAVLQQAIAGGPTQYEAAKNIFAGLNEQGCPLGR